MMETYLEEISKIDEILYALFFWSIAVHLGFKQIRIIVWGRF